MPTKDKDIFEVGLNLNVDQAQQALKKFRDSGARAASAVSKGMRALGQNVQKFALAGINKMTFGIGDAKKAYKEYGKVLSAYNAHIARDSKRMLEASEDEKKVLQDRIDKTKELKKQALREFKVKHGRGMEAHRDVVKLGKHGATAGRNLFEAGTELFSKDFKSSAKSAAQAIAAMMSSGKVTGKWAEKAGKGFWDKAKKRYGRSGEKFASGNKVGGLAEGALALGNTGLAGLSKGLGGILKMLGAMGPLLSVASGIFAGIVKLMVDAEAAAKEMNKKILEVSGSSNAFYRNNQKSGAALADMDDMLRKIRDDAASMDNIKWGISKEDHIAVLNAMSAEGVQLGELAKQYKKTGDAAKDAAGEAAIFGDAVHVAVAYSREFGVSLQEISSFQGEMMTEMGQSLDSVTKTFHMMTKGASESGIASNKFFAIIRGVSADLNLYNTRIEDAAHLLTVLGKVMSPRNAQKFLSASMGAVKNMGRVERIKVAMLAGAGKTGGVVDRDIKRGTDNLAEKMASMGKGSADQYREAIEKGGEDFTKALEDLPENMRGEIREAQLEIGVKRKMRAGKGAVGTAFAAGESGPAGQLQVLTDALKGFNGGKSLLDGINTLGEQFMAENLGISIDQLNQMAKFEVAMKDQRDVLKKTLREDKTQAKLTKAGIKLTGNDADDQKAIDQAGFDQIMDTLDEGDKEALQGAKTEMDYAKQTAQFTSSASDKLQVLIDWLMNKLWDVMSDIYDAVADIASWIIKDPTRELTKLQLKATKTGNSAIQEVVDKAKSLDDVRKGLFELARNKGQEKAMYQGTDKQRDDFAKSISDNVSKSELTSAFSKAVGATGLDEKKGQSVERNLLKGNGFADSLKKAGLTSDEEAKILDKIRMFLTTPDLMKVIAAGTSIATDDAKPTGQEQASIDAGGPTAPPDPVAPSATAPVPPAPPPAVPPPTKGVVKSVDNFADTLSQIGMSLPPPPAPTAMAGAPAVSPAHAAAVAKAKAPDTMTQDQGEAILGSLDGLSDTLSQNGIKINRSFLRNQFWKNGHDAVLDANREALLEYFLYSKMDPADVAKGLQAGNFDATTFGQGVLSGATATGTIAMPTKDQPTTKLPGMASGGTVPEPKSPDQVFVAARPGEKIIPKGQQGGGPLSLTIPISVNGPGGQELGNMMRAAAMNVVLEWQRKHKFT
jgi:hypothetical protein